MLWALGLGIGHAAELDPYGTAKVDMHKYPGINRVYDVNYDDPKKLTALVSFIKNVNAVVPGKAVVVFHGAEIRGLAKENYEKYQGVVDQLAELSKEGVDFRMCNNAMHAAGFEPSDIHGFVTIVPAGFAELISLQSQGYQLIYALPTQVKDSRYLDHPKPAGK
ncbi:MAG: DsrE family protein [Gammaproteobacteria bacterium]|nr:DsrE family protein [Gammaproteobacteria bacterium]